MLSNSEFITYFQKGSTDVKANILPTKTQWVTNTDVQKDLNIDEI